NDRLRGHVGCRHASIKLRHNEHVAAPDAVVQPLDGEDVSPGAQAGFSRGDIENVEGCGVGLVQCGRSGVPLHRAGSIGGSENDPVEKCYKTVVVLHAQLETIKGRGIRDIEFNPDINAVVVAHRNINVQSDERFITGTAFVTDARDTGQPGADIEGFK